MEYQNIKTAITSNTCIITIDRASKMNALNATLLQEIKHAVSEAEVNSDIYGIVITGDGEKAFAAGADISEFANFNPEQGRTLSANGHEVMNTIERCSKPVIAAVNGFALGGGCELAMACHMRLASPNAKFGQPEVNLGLLPGYAGTQRLIQLIGKGKATELLLTADMIKADEAHRLGLVNHIIEQPELLNTAIAMIHKIASKSPMAVQRTIDCINAYFDINRDGMQTEINHFGESFQTADFIEGTSAFMEKRQADFRK